MHIDIINANDGETLREVFRFYFVAESSGMRLRLVDYSRQTRPSKRHGWKAHQHWNTYRSRDNTLERDDVPLTTLDIEKAKDVVIQTVRELEITQ